MKTALDRLLRTMSDRRGTSAIEFALIFPCAMLLLMTATEFQMMYEADRKTTAAASTLADVAGRSEKVTVADLDRMLSAAPHLMADNTLIVVNRVSLVSLSDDGQSGTVMWGRSKTGIARKAGTPIALGTMAQTSLSCANGKVILAEVTADYTPTFGITLGGQAWQMRKTAFACPRTQSSEGVEISQS